MTRSELLKHLEETKEMIAETDTTITDYAREKAYICVAAAIDYIQENEDREY